MKLRSNEALMRVGDCWAAFQEPRAVWKAHSIGEVWPLLEVAERASRSAWVLVAIAYEAAPAFDSALRVRPCEGLLAWTAAFDEPRPFQFDDSATARAHWEAEWTDAEYRAKFEELHEAIGRGECYQGNLTFPLRAQIEDPFACFVAMVRAQPTPYAAFLRPGETKAIACASPELFFELVGNRVRCRPMKGTRRISDSALATDLASSEKDRAENLMIVDMIRNDLGRIACVGSVSAGPLFEVERHPSVLQMTSSVECETTAPWHEVLRACFPCASVTGAPKVAAMNLLASLEEGPRGFYCGAIGWVRPGGDARFGVPIRTAEFQDGQGVFGVGSGVVWDSDGHDEFAECLAKGAFLGAAEEPFELWEAIRWTPRGGWFLVGRHMERLARSSRTFHRPFSSADAWRALTRAVRGRAEPAMVRLRVDSMGRVRAEAIPLPERSVARLALTPCGKTDPALRAHKTSRRSMYEQALAERPDVDDVLFCNDRGELLESTRSNLVLRFGRRRLTPRENGEFLPGTFRAELLQRGAIEEARLEVEDLRRADAIYLINSVRLWRRAKLVEP